ncbi:MAG: NAD-dependent epimerase/dehydratase family protein [Bauldia sp.]|nr:NAD-dependent epimerase/dehydratase family protein [Bauldia sp.]
MKRALVCGGGGFIGAQLVKTLKREGYFVRAADLKRPEFAESAADEFLIGDLRDRDFAAWTAEGEFDELYQLAAEMGGAGYLFTGDHDVAVMSSTQINFNILNACAAGRIGSVFYSSSACVYPIHNQLNPNAPDCREDTAYPAAPDSEYGWEKLFSERLYQTYHRNLGVNIHIARYHNVFGPEGTWTGGREKAPAAICRKVAEARDGDSIEIWGDGRQTRTFLYVDDCLAATTSLARSTYAGPVNVGSEELVSIADLVDLVADIAGKRIEKRFVTGPTGVRGRRSDNRIAEEKLGWRPTIPLRVGLERTFAWIEEQVRASLKPHG